MNPEIPVEILSLYPRLRLPLKFGSDSDQFYAERSDTGKRFPLSEWQLELLMGMDGERNFGSLFSELELNSTTKPNIESLRSFYSWLYSEELIATVSRNPAAQESVFEIVIDEQDEVEIQEEKVVSEKVICFPKSPVRNWDQIIKTACYAATILGVIRIAWVVAPVFEPVLQRASFDIADFFQADEEPVVEIATTSAVKAERTVQPSKVDYVSVAGKFDQIKSLRGQLAACRIRRDEYYLQSDESGYRKEVRSMTLIARKIGELELTD